MSPNKRHKFAFDWDGTLVDCRARQVAVLASVWSRAGKFREMDLELCWQWKREGMNTLQALIKTGVPENKAVEMAAQWKQEVEQPQWLVQDVVFPGALPALTKVVAEGFCVIVVTARMNPDNVQRQVSQSILSGVIDDVLVVDPAFASEQKAVVLKQQNAMTFIGDSESDFQAARLSGVLFAGVGCGQRSLACLKKFGAAPLFASTQEATDHLLVRVANNYPLIH